MPKAHQFQIECTVCGATGTRGSITNVRVNDRCIHDLCGKCLRALHKAGHKLELIDWKDGEMQFQEIDEVI